MDIFDLSAKLSLDKSGFDKSVSDAESEGKGLGDSLQGVFDKIESGLKWLVTGVVVKKGIDLMKSLANETAAAGDKIDKQSQALGMSRKAYQEWDYILSQNGVSIDTMASSMKTLNNTILSAKEGGEDAKIAFEKLGLGIHEVENLDPEQQFEAVVRAFQKMPEGAEKSALAVKLFGRNGMQLLHLLNSESTSIDELRAKAEELGIIMGDDMVDASVAYTDAMDTMKRTFTALRYSIGSKLLPVFTNVMKKVTDYAGKINKAYQKDGFKGALQALKEIGSELGLKIKEGLKQVKINLAEWLGVENAGADTKWSDMGEALAKKIHEGINKIKVSLVKWLGVETGEGEATWKDVGQGLAQKIKDGINLVKVKLSSWLGIDKEEGEATWTDIGKGLAEKIRDGVKKIKFKIASWLGIEKEEGEATWTDIGESLATKIHEGIKKVKVKLATWLGIDKEEGEASWVDIGEGLGKKLKEGMEKLKLKLGNLLGLTDENGKLADGTDWAEIGKEILNKMTSYFSHKGDFLARLILGEEEFNNLGDKSKWVAVGEKISGWLSEAFADGGLINVLLTSGLEKVTAFAEIAGKFIQGIAEWIAKPENINTLVGIITTLVNALAQAAGPIVKALITIISDLLTDPSFWSTIVHALIQIAKAIWNAIMGYEEEEDPAEVEKRLQKQYEEEMTPEAIAAREAMQEHQASQYDLTPEQKAALGRFYADRVAHGGTDSSDDAIWDLMGAFPEGQLENGFYPYYYWMNKAKDWAKTPGAAPELPEDFFNVEVSGDFTDETPANMQSDLDGYGLTAPVEGYLTGVDGNGYTDGGNPGHNAKGMWDVPYDDYLTTLHRDEMVLNASRARDYREGNFGRFDMGSMMAGFKGMIREAFEGVTVRSFINGRDVTDEVNRTSVKQLKARRFAT